MCASPDLPLVPEKKTALRLQEVETDELTQKRDHGRPSAEVEPWIQKAAASPGSHQPPKLARVWSVTVTLTLPTRDPPEEVTGAPNPS